MRGRPRRALALVVCVAVPRRVHAGRRPATDPVRDAVRVAARRSRRGQDGADHGGAGDASALHPGRRRADPVTEVPTPPGDRGGGGPGRGGPGAHLRPAGERRADHGRRDGSPAERLLRRLLPRAVLRTPEPGMADDRRAPGRRRVPGGPRRVPAGSGPGLLQLAERGARLRRRRRPQPDRAVRAGARAHARDRRPALRPGPPRRARDPVRGRAVPGRARHRRGQRQPLRDAGAHPVPGRRRRARSPAAVAARSRPSSRSSRRTPTRSGSGSRTRCPTRTGRAAIDDALADVPDHDRAGHPPRQVPGRGGRVGRGAGLRARRSVPTGATST